MNRRDFLIRSSLAVSAGLLTRSILHAQTPAAIPAAPAVPPTPAKPVFTPLRRNVGHFTARGGTIGWLVNKDALAAIDTQFPDTAELFLAGLHGRDGRKFDAVLNTHHHGDHTGGNATFKPATQKIVAHENVPDLMRAAANRANQPFNPLTLPTETYPETWKGTFGDEIISARHFGPAHTKGDVVITFEKANVVHMGDIMFNRIYPVIDRFGGASIQGWITSLEKIAADYPADAIYIFGHSNPKFPVSGNRGELLILRDFLTVLLAYTQKQIAAGQTKEQITALENFPGFPEFHQTLPNRLGTDLGVAYDELTAARS